jgi:hypothetical protein
MASIFIGTLGEIFRDAELDGIGRVQATSNEKPAALMALELRFGKTQ